MPNPTGRFQLACDSAADRFRRCPNHPHWVKEMYVSKDLNHDRVNGPLPGGIE
jgi:hypothetical protein